MSFRLMAWASRQATGNPTRKAVLLMLADRANDDTGRCDPSIKRLAADVDATPNTVKKALAALADAGLIEVVRRKRDDGSDMTNHYRFPREAWNVGGGVKPGRGEGSESDPGEGADIDPEPGLHLNQESEPGTLPAAPVYDPRKGVRIDGQDLVWNALASVIDTTEAHGSRMKQATTTIRGVIVDYIDRLAADRPEVTPDEFEAMMAATVAMVARRVREANPGLTWGPEGMARHFRRGLELADTGRTTDLIVEEALRASAG